MLVKGCNLNADQKQIVLNAFIYRWTIENPNRERLYNQLAEHGLNSPTMPLETDQQFLNSHAFHFTKDGERLDHRYHYCEPEYNTD